MPLVDIRDLKVSFSQYGGEVHAVRGVSFAVWPACAAAPPP